MMDSQVTNPGQHLNSPVSQVRAFYRFRAVVDWIELRIVTIQPSNFDTVMKRMQVPFVDALDKGAGGAATVFIVRIQEPQSWAAIDERIARFTHDHPLAEPILVTGIEIALDAYSRWNDRDNLVEMVARFYKFSTKMVSDNRRLTKGKNLTEGVGNYPSLMRSLGEGANLYIGNRNADVFQHMYVKETETVGGQLVWLPREKRRARTEFTLRGQALPLTALTDWQQHEFTTMADFFKYRVLKTCLAPMVSRAVQHVDQIGERRERATKQRRPRFFSKSTVADKELNALAYSALSELTKRMRA